MFFIVEAVLNILLVWSICIHRKKSQTNTCINSQNNLNLKNNNKYLGITPRMKTYLSILLQQTLR